jgi:hypothetical protein
MAFLAKVAYATAYLLSARRGGGLKPLWGESRGRA